MRRGCGRGEGAIKRKWKASGKVLCGVEVICVACRLGVGVGRWLSLRVCLSVYVCVCVCWGEG